MNLEKSSLQYVIDDKIVLTNDKILKIFRQIIDAMSFGYTNLQISHSDIKPANILKINDDFYI